VSPSDPEHSRFVEHTSNRLKSRAMYARLKAMVDSWEREERANEKIAVRAIGALVVLAVTSIAAFRFVPYVFNLVLWGGFILWVAYVVVLMRLHLGRDS
jgi:hypothetical protein